MYMGRIVRTAYLELPPSRHVLVCLRLEDWERDKDVNYFHHTWCRPL